MSLWKKITGSSWKNMQGVAGVTIGAVAGYLVGGPAGAIYGAGMGYMLTDGRDAFETEVPEQAVVGGDYSAQTAVAQADAEGDAAANEERKKLAALGSRGRAGTVLTAQKGSSLGSSSSL